MDEFTGIRRAATSLMEIQKEKEIALKKEAEGYWDKYKDRIHDSIKESALNHNVVVDSAQATRTNKLIKELFFKSDNYKRRIIIETVVKGSKGYLGVMFKFSPAIYISWINEAIQADNKKMMV